MADSSRDRAALVADRKKRSYDWLKDNYFGEWESVFKSYKCERDPAKDEDGKDDPTQTSLALPMTHSLIRRTVARATAQLPNLKFRAKDPEIGEIVSRTLMMQWDKGGIQRQQKRHFTQAAMFGISVRPFFWAVEEYTRRKRIDPMAEGMPPETLGQVAQTYGVPMKYLMHPEVGPVILARLLGKFGRGGLLPVEYTYKGYEGPKCEFLFIGDCYFEPNFQSLQSSNWFIVERRRNKEWIEAVVKRYPEFAEGFNALLRDHPNGTPRPVGTRETQGLRERMQAAVGRSDTEAISSEERTNEWTITEMHVPGPAAKLSYVAEENISIGEIPYPYDLDGRIAFTTLTLIDDLLAGIGDSTARIIRGLQALHDRQVNQRFDLIGNILRPLIGTTNRELIQNPQLIKRHKGFRLVHMRGPGDMWMQGEQAAMAAAAAGLQDESAIMRLYQLATGESNMSMGSNVDPQQARTATGARIMAYNQDVLSKDLVDMFNETSVKADAEMMYLLNRSELADAIDFDAAQYNRIYSPQQDLLKEQWIRAEPIHFQTDGEITAEVGSTLADDDEAKVTKAMTLWQAASARPDLFNQATARDEFLVAMGKGRDLDKWAAPPPPPPPPPEIKGNVSLQLKWELLSEQEREFFKQRMGMPAEQPQGPPGGAGPGLAPPPNPEDAITGASAYAAAKGNSPFQQGMPG